MKTVKDLVSIVIPIGKHNPFLEQCLLSIKKQTYRKIETLLVTSEDDNIFLAVAKKFNTKIYNFTPVVSQGVFDATIKRNYGAGKTEGEYIYYLDSDMELTKNVISEAVDLCKSGFDAVIVPEDSIGVGLWARAKNLERRCYFGDDSVEAPRFVKTVVWKKIGGLDEKLGGGGDDWDLYQKLKEKGYKTGRINSLALHNEGKLSLGSLFKKRFMYGRESLKYLKKRPRTGLKSYFPIRKSYLRNWRLFLSRPVDAFAFVIMRTLEYLAGSLGVLYSIFK